MMNRAPQFGDLAEEVATERGEPATRIILLRPKVYLVFNEHDPLKSKTKIKGIGYQDMCLPDEIVPHIQELVKKKNWNELEKIYTNGYCELEKANYLFTSAVDYQNFVLGYENRKLTFLCAQFIRIRKWHKDFSDITFNVKRVFRIKHLTF